MTLSYPKTLTEIDLRQEHNLSFRTQNKHILLIKRDFDDDRSLAKILSWARVSTPEAKKMEFESFNYRSNGFLKDFNCW